MAWQRHLGIALTVVGLASCQSSSSLGRTQLLNDPDLVGAVNRAGAGQSADASRGQKPDGVQPVSLLDLAPQRSGGIAGDSAVSIRAIVNDQAILDEEVRASAYQEIMRARSLSEPERSQKTAEIFNSTLTQLIEREVVLQDAFARLKAGGKNGEQIIGKLKDAASKEFDRRVLKPMKESVGIKNDAELKKFFNEQGVALDSIRRQWERNFMMMEYLRNRVIPVLDSKVNHQLIVEYYDGHPEEFQVADSVQWQDLFLVNIRHNSREETRALAESLVDRARKGEDFVALVKKYDEGDSSLRNGDGVGNKRGEIKPVEAEPTLFNLQEGQIGPILELETGFHIVKLIKRVQAGQTPFDAKVQQQIKDKLRNEVAQREIKRMVAELKRKAVIEYAHSAK